MSFCYLASRLVFSDSLPSSLSSSQAKAYAPSVTRFPFLLVQVSKIVLPPRRNLHFSKIKGFHSKDVPKSPRRAPKTRPRAPQEAPRAVKEAPRGPQRRSKSTKSLLDSSSHNSIVLKSHALTVAQLQEPFSTLYSLLFTPFIFGYHHVIVIVSKFHSSIVI